MFEAIRQRRCYGVSAAQRIHVELAVNGLPMGAEGQAAGPVRISGRVAGTGPIERIDLFRGLEILTSLSPYSPASFAGSRRYRIAWAGSRVRGRDRLTIWDGRLELSAGRIVDAVPFAMFASESVFPSPSGPYAARIGASPSFWLRMTLSSRRASFI